MRIALQPAFILHHRPYRETSLILDLLTFEYGRISAVARGVRGPKSQSKGLLQLFIPLLISWQGKSELVTLTAIESKGTPIHLRGDCLFSAMYLNELLTRLMHKYDPHPNLYTIYHETLLTLQSGILDQKTLRIFEKRLLEELGYGLQLQYDNVNGNLLKDDQFYRFHPEQGFTLHLENSSTAKVWIFSGKSLIALAQETLEAPEALQDAKRLMRLALAALLGTQPLNSRKLFLEVDSQ